MQILRCGEIAKDKLLKYIKGTGKCMALFSDCVGVRRP